MCISNLNLLGLAAAYAWLDGPGAAWAPPPVKEVYVAKDAYAHDCMPDDMRRY